MDIVAFEAFNQVVHLHNFQDTVLVQLKLPAGVYVLSAKMEFLNSDGDSQLAHAVMKVQQGTNAIDQTTVRLGGDPDANQQCVSLLTVWTFPNEDVVVVSGSTFKGGANWVRFVATRVDKVQIEH